VNDKRSRFFALTSLVCFALVPLAQHQYRELTFAVGVVYVLLAAASWLDSRSRR